MQPVLPWYLKVKAESFKGFTSGVVVLFTLPFLIGGLVCVWALAVRPTMDWIRARSWEATDAVVEKAWLEVSHGDDDDNYKVAVQFRYKHRGTAHTGKRHSFVSSFSSIGVSGMREAVDQLKPGATVTCWVNPDDPAEAVLDRSLPAQAVPGLFFATPFVTVGIVGQGYLFLPLLRRRFLAKRQAQMADLMAAGALPDWVLHPFNSSRGGPENDVTLVISADERLTQTLRVIFFNLFWNGLVGTFVCMDIGFIASGDTGTGLFLSLFLTPFVAVGFVMLWMLVKCWQAIRRPGWVAAMRPVPDLEGGPVAFCWAWVDIQRLVHPPQAAVRIVAQAAPWDEESGSATSTFTQKRRTKLSDAGASRKDELELAAVEVLIVDAPREIQVTLPWVPFPSTDSVPRPRWQPKADWGGWWQLEVTYRDGELELAELTKAEKLLM